MTTVDVRERGGLLRGTTRQVADSVTAEGVLRGLAAAGAVTGAVVHLLLWADGFRTITWIGPLFLLDVLAGYITGVAVVAARHWLSAAAVALFGAGTLAAFLSSVFFGLFGVRETLNGWPQLTAGIGELVALIAGVILLALHRGRRGLT